MYRTYILFSGIHHLRKKHDSVQPCFDPCIFIFSLGVGRHLPWCSCGAWRTRGNAEMMIRSLFNMLVYFPSVRLSHISKFQTKARSRYELTNLIQFRNRESRLDPQNRHNFPRLPFRRRSPWLSTLWCALSATPSVLSQSLLSIWVENLNAHRRMGSTPISIDSFER